MTRPGQSPIYGADGATLGKGHPVPNHWPCSWRSGEPGMNGYHTYLCFLYIIVLQYTYYIYVYIFVFFYTMGIIHIFFLYIIVLQYTYIIYIYLCFLYNGYHTHLWFLYIIVLLVWGLPENSIPGDLPVKVCTHPSVPRVGSHEWDHHHCRTC